MIMAQSIHCVCCLLINYQTQSYSTSVVTIKPSKMEPKSSKSTKKKKFLCNVYS